MKLLRNIAVGIAVILTAAAISIGVFAQDTKITGKTAAEISDMMGIGWNLGNTLESTNSTLDDQNLGVNLETYWGNPKTTKAMIDMVKAEGFDSVRIPVTWFKHLNSNGTIDSAWLSRVKEVVDYCIDDGLFVILNTHHDSKWIDVTSSGYSATSAKLKSLWTQIGTYFADYDQRLVFEGLSEPRYDGTDIDWVGDDAARKIINKYNNDFVTTVRALGGNNSERCLMLTTYACATAVDDLDIFEVPKDAGNIMASVHCYTPYSLCLENDIDKNTFTDAGISEINSLFERLNTYFTKKGIPVVMGEFSCSNKNNTTERIEWATYFASKAKNYNIPIFLWDNNVYTGNSNVGEQHGYLNRNKLSWYNKDVVDELIVSYHNTTVNLPSEDGDINVFSGSASSSSWGQAVTLSGFDFTSIIDKQIVVTFTSANAPEIIVQDNEYNIWSKTAPSSVADGVAYFDGNTIASNYASAYSNEYKTAISAPFLNAGCLYIGDTGTSLKVTDVTVKDSNSLLISVSSAVLSGISTSYKYTGKAIKPAVTLTLGSKTLILGTDYTLLYKNCVGSGTATVVAQGTGKYTGMVSKNYTIIKDAVGITSAKVSLSYTSATYSGAAKKPAVTVKYGTETLKNGTDYSVSYSNNINAGTAKVTIKGLGDFNGTVTKSFTINKKSVLRFTLALSSTSYTYSGTAKKPAVTLKNGTKVISAANYTVTYSSNINCGKGLVKITGKGNYSGTVTKYFYIKPAKATGLKTSTRTTTAVTLKWTKSKGVVTGYEIYQAKGTSTSYTKIASIKGASNITYKKTGLTAGTDYKYKIRAYKVIDGKKYYGAYSAVNISGTRTKAPAISSLTAGSKAVTVKWKKVSGADGYRVFVSTSKNGTYKLYSTVSGNSTCSKTVKRLTKGKTYYFKVKAYIKINGSKYDSSYSPIKSKAAK